ncbi:MAG: phosphomannomutase, partial [Kiritimatiellae bacterium]|nr:phosphomannomutase [Kiritimatiellia bacterium]
MIISELMESCGVKFGTSGARGLVVDMTDEVCFAYSVGFIQHLKEQGELPENDKRIAIAGDLRGSTDRIMAAVAGAVIDCGCRPVNCGKLPSPAVALYGLQQGIPAIMVTGSHIPDDRNGIKYNKPSGEVLKSDETGMMKQAVVLPDIFDDRGMLLNAVAIGPVEPIARQIYLDRWLNAFPDDFLKGKRIGLYQHSAVGRDLLFEIYTELGAEVTKLGASEVFVPVDTEAIRPEDVEMAHDWAVEYSFDAIVSTDGDSDRPLISDEHGKWLRGDVAGILCAQYLGADIVVTPVSCNTAVEKCGTFKEVRRTRIGSPYVIAEMNDAVSGGADRVVGYEANGGFLTATEFQIPDGGMIEALPTRDAVIIHLSILGLSVKKNIPISQILSCLPHRITASDRLKEFPPEKSRARITELEQGGGDAIEAVFSELGAVAATDS